MSSIPYSNRFQMEIVDQWRKCYINYALLKLCINVIKDCNRQSVFMAEQQKIDTKRSAAKKNDDVLRFILNSQILNIKKELINNNKQELKKVAQDTNAIFIDCYKRQIQLYNQFVLFKFQEIIQNFHISRNFYYLAKTEELEEFKDQFRSYLQYLFVQSNFLSCMVRANIQAENRLLQKHKLYSFKNFETPQPQIQKCLKIHRCNELKRQIQCFYIQVNKMKMNSSRERIETIGQQVRYNKHIQSMFIGLLSGCLVTIIIFMCIILSREHIVLEVDPIFNQHFPLWRGISTYIFYVWMLGTNLLFFERFKISHKIILEIKYISQPKSNDLFKIASFFSVVFIVLFIIYALQMADIIQTNQMSPEWLPLFAWGLFLIFLINPIPIIFASGRLYTFKMLSKVITSIFLQANFLTELAVVQLFALISAMQDTVYTICFYTHLNLPLAFEQQKQADICKAPSSLAKFIFTIFLYAIRIWHCMRNVFRTRNQQKFYKHRDFCNIVKYLTSLTTTILSFLWRDANNGTILPAWIVFAAISTIYSFIWDWKMSFDLLKLKSKNYLLRDEIVFPKNYYYFWIICTFFLRCSWTLYISPNISKSFLGSPQIFTLTFGYLQIIRRGIWNVIKVELEQVRNREVFRAVPKQKQVIEDMIYQKVQKNKISNNQSAQSIVDVQANGETVLTQKQRKKMNMEKKLKIVTAAGQLFDHQLSMNIKAQKYQQQVRKKIKQLMNKVYD